ncbi:MAG: NAD(P)/FAD-dependent oxidoreductase [Halobacteriales archaeon]
MDRHDVIVVGGGPAGSNAGRAAAEAGADALVLEQGIPRQDREGLGPDSTDAAGMLDYWVDIMELDPAAIPDEVVLQPLEGVDFISPHEAVALETTGMEATYDGLGFTFHRARMDDWMRERAEAAGAHYAVGHSVTAVDLDPDGGHRVETADGEAYEADALVLADGPQRRVTLPVLEQVLPAGHGALDRLSPPNANHIAYQEYRRFPDEAFERDRLKFWWGYMPGETAYPWVFPNDDPVARVGFTMPIGLDLADVRDPGAYPLLDPDDDRLPDGATYIHRLLERVYGDAYDVEADFPLVEDRGKRGGTETYAISSTRPIDSPVGAGVAIAGGAMGTTSAFHEGGYHVATRTGAIAGDLAARGELGRYNRAWKDAIGDEILRNVVFGDLVADYEPADWDRAFATANRMKGDSSEQLVSRVYRAGWHATTLWLAYNWGKLRYRDGRYVQLTESEYVG